MGSTSSVIENKRGCYLAALHSPQSQASDWTDSYVSADLVP